MENKTIAREWLLFVGLLLAGLVILPVAITGGVRTLPSFYEALSKWEGLAWAVALGPYVVVQLARSVTWAVRLLAKSNETPLLRESAQMTTNPNRPTSTKTLLLVGVVLGLAVAIGAFIVGADRETGTRFGGLAQGAIGVAILIGGGWAALRRRKKS